MDLYSPLTALTGIGTTRATQLRELGLETIYDLLCYFPRTYEDRTKLVNINELEVDVPACFQAMVASTPRTNHIRKGLSITKLSVADSTGRINLVYFNQPYAADNLRYGEEYVFYGALTGDYLGYQMQNPTFESPSSDGVSTRRIMPVYPLAARISNKLLSKTVHQALESCCASLPELLPVRVLEQYSLCSVSQAYASIHEPASFDTLEQARKRLAFEEFFVFSVGLQLLRKQRNIRHTEPYRTDYLVEFNQLLPFSLTTAQQRVINEISDDLTKGVPMNRLLQGDVGSGKTMIAAAAAFLAIRNNKQAALMAPTEILAEQHYRSLSTLFEPLGISVALLTGSATAADKRKVKDGLTDGSLSLVIGTHALLTSDVTFRSLDLVIADEQHRFGVAQRAALSEKGTAPHLLVMSATPIPRTLALIAYGDLDISVLDELPPGRQTVDTFLVREQLRGRINAFIRKHAENGNQIYVVCPAVEESEEQSLKSAESWAENLQRAIFPDLRVGLLHGRMKGSDKEQIMSDFSAHRLDILVSTTVIEVGVDVPNATLMIIEDADRFGLSQLHQLRGRVGRGQDKSYCILISSNKNQETLARLKALCSTNDGFKIAEEDLKLRGPGDFLGSRQSGLPQFKTTGLTENIDLLIEARKAAEEAVSDPDFVHDPAFEELRVRIRHLLNQNANIFN